jgi:hypothetical protein
VVLELKVPRAGTLRNLFVHARVAGTDTNGDSIVYTVQVNGADTAIVVSMLATATDGSDLVNTVAVAQGDRVGIKVTKTGVITGSPSDIIATLELA